MGLLHPFSKDWIEKFVFWTMKNYAQKIIILMYVFTVTWAYHGLMGTFNLNLILPVRGIDTNSASTYRNGDFGSQTLNGDLKIDPVDFGQPEPVSEKFHDPDALPKLMLALGGGSFVILVLGACCVASRLKSRERQYFSQFPGTHGGPPPQFYHN